MGSGCWPGSGLLQDAASLKAVLPGMPRGGALISHQRAEGWAGHPARERSSLQLVGSGVAASFSLARASGSPGPQARMARGGAGGEGQRPGGPPRLAPPLPHPGRLDVDQELQDGPRHRSSEPASRPAPTLECPRWPAAPRPQAPVWSWQPGSCFPTTFRTRGDSGPVSSRPGATGELRERAGGQAADACAPGCRPRRPPPPAGRAK